MGLIDAARQVKGILPKRFGGTGNRMGWGEGVVVPYQNISGAAIPVGSIVQQEGAGGARMIPCDTLDSVMVVGVVVGYYQVANGLTTLIQGADVPDNELGAVMLSGRCRVLMEADADKNDYVFQSATDGQAYGSPTAAAGAFGILESDGVLGELAYVRLFGTVLLSGGGSTSPLTTKGDLYGYDTADARVPVGADGTVLQADSADAQGVAWTALRHAVVVTLNAPTNGMQADWRWPWDGTITRWTLAGDASGSIKIDIWSTGFVTDTPPTNADTITGGAEPELTSDVLVSSTSLGAWDTSFSRGDMVRINVDSQSGLTRATLILEVTSP